MRLDDVTGETIQGKLDAEQFEQFVGMLLRAEFQARHAADVNNGVTGPGPRGSRGPWDLRVRVTKAPRVAADVFRVPLTFDEIGETWYGCKTGPNWLELVRRDFGGRAEARKKQSRKVKKSTKKMQQTTPSDALLDHLARGGRDVVCIDRQIGDERILDEIDTSVQSACTARGRASQSVRMQLSLITGERLAEFLRMHRPPLTEPLRNALGISEPEGLLPWSRWTTDLHGERGKSRDPIPFESDPIRRSIVEALGSGDPTYRVLRVSGPPGVGKTRVVYEGLLAQLGKPGAEARVRYAKDPEHVRRLVESERLAGMGNVVLVCDEMRTFDIEAIQAHFHVWADPRARLVFIGTSDGAGAGPDHFVLDRLADEQVRSLVRHEAKDAAEALIDGIVRSSGGYPWYAVLLARATAPEHAPLTLPELQNPWTTAKRVLATRARDIGEQAWNATVEARGRCLLVVMLTQERLLEWGELRKRHGDALDAFLVTLSPAVDASAVWAAELDCRERQILRHSGVSRVQRYVSPNLLAKIILEHYFGGDDDGPRNLRKLLEHAPELREGLRRLLTAVDAHPNIATTLSQFEWDEMLRRARSDDLAAIEQFTRLSGPAILAAHEAPEHAIAAMAAILDHVRPQQWALLVKTRAALAFSLARALRRRLSDAAFELGERVAFRLAERETDEHANPAIRLWMSLARPDSRMSQTHASWSTRLRLLDAHLAAADADERGKALEAVGRALDVRASSLGYVAEDLRDGEWPSSTPEQWRAANHQLWSRLLTACADTGPHGAFARRLVADRVGGGLEQGLSAKQVLQLAADVSSWSSSERSVLLEQLGPQRRSGPTMTPDLRDALDVLEHALQPKDALEQLHQQVDQWFPGPWPIDDPARVERAKQVDDRLAAQLLAEGLIDPALAWLVEPAAVRRRWFASALGRVDTDRLALARLAASSPHRDQHLLSSYLLGWSVADGVEPVDAWIAEHIDEPELGSELISTIGLMPPSTRHLAWFVALVGRGIAYEQFSVPWQAWIECLPMPALIELAAQLSAHPALGVDLMLDILDAPTSPELEPRALDVLDAQLHASTRARVVIAHQYDWERGVLRLAEAGRFDAVVALLVQPFVSGSMSNIGLEQTVFRKLLERGLGPRLWPALARILDDPGQVGDLDWRLHRLAALAQLDADVVLAWADHDRGRALTLARCAAPYDVRLDAITRGLVVRFGAASEVGRQLTRHALSSVGIAWTDTAIAFERQQLAHTRAWQANHDEPEVRRWAAELEQELSHRIAEHEARLEFRRRYG